MLRFFSSPEAEDALAYLAATDRLTVIVGAGSSKEVGLPTWRELVDRILREALGSRRQYRADRDWLVDQLMTNDLMSAAERAQVLLGRDGLEPLIRKCLYGRDSEAEIEPGPTAFAVAELRRVFGDALRIITTNYDQLLVTALRRSGFRSAASYCTGTSRVGVLHLHGVIGFEPPRDGDNHVVLTEGDYLAPSASGWRTDLIRTALDGPCLFLGASLTDLNLLTPLHNQLPRDGVRHFVLVVRPAITSSDDARRQTSIESIDLRRWNALGVTPLFVDNYADVAQFGFELAARRADPSTPSLSQRFLSWHRTASRSVMSVRLARFRASQLALSDGLGKLLRGLRSDLVLDDERMSLGVCALFPPATGEDHERPINWVTSDRAMTTPHTLEFLNLTPDSQWTVVKAICAGVPRAEPKVNYASRWRYVWAEPIFASEVARIPLGAVALSTMAASEDTRLPSPGPTDERSRRAVQTLRQALREAGTLVLAGSTS